MAINYENNNITGSGSLFINNSGNFASGLYVNNIPVSLSGHSHSLKIGDGFTDQISYLSSDRLNIVGTGGTLISFNDSLNTITISGAPNLTNVVFTTGNQNISGIKTFFDNIVSSGQISAPSGKFDHITSDKDFTINGTLNINAAASILASGPITFVGNPYVVSGAGYFTSGLFVGPTGSATPVSLSGHRQAYSTIDNFCTGVAECVNTPLLAGTGISLSYVNGTGLYINASGIQILSSSSGFVVKTGINNYTTRLISNGNNINISYADGISANPIIELSGSLDLIKDITSTGNLKANSGIFSSGITLNGTGVSLSGHTHSISDITSLQTTLDSKQPSLTNPVTGVGTSGYLTKWISSSGISSGVIFDNETNIGIGTSSPSGKLDINGTLYVGTTGVANNFYIRTGQAGISETALKLRSDTSSNLYLDASNAYVKVGNQSADVDIAAGNAGIRIGNNSAQTLANQNIRFVPANTEIMRITPTGVGVGTSTPSSQLHVVGTGTFDNSIRLGSSSTSGTIIGLSTSGTIPAIIFDTVGNNHGNQQALYDFRENGVSLISIDGLGNLQANAGNIVGFAANPSVDAGSFIGHGMRRRLTNAGMEFTWGESITSVSEPGIDLFPAGGTHISSGILFRLSKDSNKTDVAVIVDGSGRVGIGTSTPSGQLHVIGSGIFSSGIRVGDSATNGYVIGPSGNTFIQFNQSSNNTIRLDSNTYSNSHTYLNTQFTTINSQSTYCNGSFQFPITNSAATSTATQRDSNPINFFNRMWNGSSETQGKSTIEVKASTTTNLLSRLAFSTHIGDGTTTLAERMCINSSDGNVGIGTTAPIAPLHIANSLTGSAANSGVLINTTHLPTSNGQSISSLNVSPTFSNVAANIANTYGLLISPVSSGQFTTTNSYGLYVNAANILNGSVTNNYAAVFMSGNVGIGTASPSARLEVAASATTSVDIAHFSNSNGMEKAKFSLSSNGDGTLSLIDGNNVTNAFLSSSSTSSSYVNGKFGIGTSTPSSQLHVSGLIQGNTVGTTGTIISNSHASQTANGQDHTSLYINPTFLTSSSNLGNTYGLLISPSHSGTYATTNSYGLYVNASTLVSGTLYNNYAATFMGGNVGIGTSSPSARLHATIADGNSVLLLNRSTTLAGISLDFTGGFSNLRSYYGLKIFTGSTTANAGTERVHFTDTGLVGIGTSTPSGQLHVVGDTYIDNSFKLYIVASGASKTRNYIWSPSNGNLEINAGGPRVLLSPDGGTVDIGGTVSQSINIGHGYLNAGANNQHLRFTPGGTELMRITNSGTMGIGLPTTNNLFNQQPYANTRVHIAGSGADSGSAALIVTNSGISPLLYVRNDGNIGIGTTSPAANLHVNGSGIFSSGLNINGNISIDNNQLYINKTGIFLPFGSSLIPAIKFSGYTTSTFATMDTVICNELNVNNSLYLSTSEDPQTSPGLFFSTNGEGVAGISSNTYGDTVTILANNLRNSLVESATFDSFGINTENLYATSTQSQFVNTQTITAQDLLVKQGVIKVNNSYNNAYSMTINSSGINIVYNAGNAEVKYTDPVELPTALVTSNLISAYTITSDYFILPNYQIGELVLFKEFTGANAVYNGIYSIQNTSPVVAGNIRLVRASGYTNGTTLNDGFSVNVSNNNIQQKYVLNGTSIIGTNNLIFSPDLGESVMSLASNKNISFAEGIYAKEKYFKIKHPDPDSGYSFLQYGSLESPYHGVRLTGKDKLKNGICEILLPDYLKYLIHEEDVSIQLTNYGHHKMLYVDKIDLKNNKFIVKGYRSKSGGPFNFYWSFTGIRKDVPNLIPEQ